MMVPQPAQALVLLFKPDREARDTQTRDAVAAGSSPFFLWCFFLLFFEDRRWPRCVIFFESGFVFAFEEGLCLAVPVPVLASGFR